VTTRRRAQSRFWCYSMWSNDHF